MFTAARLQQRLTYLENKLPRAKLKLDNTRGRRLFIGLVTAGSWLAAALKPQFLVLQLMAFLIGPCIFVYFYKISKNLERHLLDLQALYDFYLRQLQRKKGKPIDETANTTHPLPNSALINDFDLFGAHSLFQLINETFTPNGEKALTELILGNCSDKSQIEERQKKLHSLRGKFWPLIRIVLIGKQRKSLNTSADLLSDFTKRSVLENSFYRDFFILLALSLLSVIGFIQAPLYALWSPWLFPILHLCYFLYASTQLKGSFARANNISIHLSNLAPIFKKLESKDFSNQLSEHLPQIASFKPSQKIASINFILAALSVQAHPLVYVLLNAFIPWSFVFTWLLDKKRSEMSEIIEPCLDELAELEAWSSLVFLSKFQTDVFPALTDELKLQFTDLSHPLIDQSSVVSNSFSMKDETHLNLITGSNMAGKSTFLRAVGINHVLMQMGAPVFAKDYITHAYFLTSSIRVSDSLADGFSYFYAEVRRLKEIIEQANADKPILFFIDEIFRGTNNRERYIGSHALIEALAKSKGRGFVSTHDLELTKIAEENSRIENFHFKDEVVGEELSFPYKILSGPCPTTNALTIMKKAGLPV